MNVMTVHTAPDGDSIARKVVEIHAPPSTVWEALTKPELMKKWMADTETEIHVDTDWTVGHSIRIYGKLHRMKYRNYGTVLRFERERIVAYNHLSSLSRLPDETRNYVVLEFRLTAVDDQTNLELTLSHFPTESILKHLVFYWNVTLEILKKIIEEQA